jgi:thymidine phosphorylase
MADRRAGRSVTHRLSGAISPAQVGAALRLTQDDAIILEGPALAGGRSFGPQVDLVFQAGPASELVSGAEILSATMEAVAGPWFSDTATPLDLACAGFWLGDLFLRRVDARLSSRITNFLLGASRVHRTPAGRVSVRRYPTGGISEKQALLLPALLRSLASPMEWQSPFLVARRLGHTGGTADKLAALPGFTTVRRERLRSWDLTRAPVYYLSAGPDLCPRDAAMYRLRGETGTVADPGLMAASIMSKQIAAPADVTILDILHGRTAFLSDSASAETFGAACRIIGEDYGVRIEPVTRRADGLLGRSIGARIEILEAVLILRGEAADPLARAERNRALDFTERLAAASGRSPDQARSLAETALASGQAFCDLLNLWRDHGVGEAFLSAVRDNPRKALLGDLEPREIRATRPGRVSFNPVALADAVNSLQKRAVTADRLTAAAGGLELLVDEGDCVAADQPIARLYGPSTSSSVSAVARILEPGGD